MSDDLTKPTSQQLPQRRSNMKITLRHRIEYILTFGLLKMMRFIGIDAASYLSGKLLRVIGPFLRGISRRSEENLTRIYPDWEEKKIKQVTAGVWENLGRVGGEFAHFDKFSATWDVEDMRAKLERVEKIYDIDPAIIKKLQSQYQPAGENARIELKASEDFLAVLAQGKTAVYVTGHFANWEVMSVVCSYFHIPCAILFRATNNALIDELIIKTRSVHINQWQIPKGPEGYRSFIDALKQGYSMGILTDQKFNAGIKIPLMGHDAMTPTTPTRMAIHHDVPIIPISVRRLKGANFVMTAHDRIDIPSEGDLATRIKVGSIRINEFLSDTINEDPSQWLWLHRRWGK